MILNIIRTAIVFVIHEYDLDCNLQQSIWLRVTRNATQHFSNEEDNKNSYNGFQRNKIHNFHCINLQSNLDGCSQIQSNSIIVKVHNLRLHELSARNLQTFL